MTQTPTPSHPKAALPTPAPSLAVYEQIASVIERQIDAGLFLQGQRIYSTREICQTFGVGDVTAKRAVRLLKQRGVVHSVVGSGAYVRQSRSLAPTSVPTRPQGVGMLMLGAAAKPIFQHEIDLLQQELQRLGHPMVYAAALDLSSLEGTVHHLLQSGVGCLVVFPRHGAWSEGPQYFQQLRAPGLPLLLLESLSPQDDCIAADIPHATALLVEHLYELGHRRLCLMSAYQRKVDGFFKAIRNLRDPAVEAVHLSGSSDHQAEMNQLVQQMLSLTRRPTAVIACNDRMADVVVQGCLHAGLDVPGDISIATYDDHPVLGAHASIPLTVVRHPGMEIAQEVARWAHDRLRGSTPAGRFRRIVTGSLIVRDSTAAPASSRRASESRENSGTPR